jgi:hypothetical protein
LEDRSPPRRPDHDCSASRISHSAVAQQELTDGSLEHHGRRGELILATSTVEDFDRWLKIFSTKSVETRKQHGSKGSTVFCDPNEDGRVWVLFDWDEEDWKNFISDPDFRAMLQEAGLISRPQMAELAGQYDA